MVTKSVVYVHLSTFCHSVLYIFFLFLNTAQKWSNRDITLPCLYTHWVLALVHDV